MMTINIDGSAARVANLLKKYVDSKCEGSLKWFADVGDLPELHDLLYAINLLDACSEVLEEAWEPAAEPAKLEELPIKTYNKLTRNGITDVEALCGCTVDDLLDMKGVGAAMINEIITMLSAHGLALREER